MIKFLVLLTIFAAIIATVLYAASQADTQTLLEQVENSVGQWIGGAL